MAQALEDVMGERLHAGLVVTKYGHAEGSLQRCRILEAGHPIPDAAGIVASQAVTGLVRGLTARDLLLVAVSGGASALLPAPPSPITLENKQHTTDMLLRAGANIRELNVVRKQLSTLKGGRLAALAYPATVVGLLLSDVIGDDPGTIGSGLTVPDSSTPEEALAILSSLGVLLEIPAPVRAFLESAGRAARQVAANVHNVIVGSNRLALQAAAIESERLSYNTCIESAPMQGEARTAALEHTTRLLKALASQNLARPFCCLRGGETTVTVHGSGKGGRCQEYALAAALALSRQAGVLIMSASTDGTDGPTDAAGAFATGLTVEQGRELGLDAADYLARNDSYRFFDASGGLVRTGPTGTNVMDIALALVA